MLELINKAILPAAYLVLPAKMASPEASAMLMAIGLQESDFDARRQVRGPARGFWQFEKGGVAGVREHRLTKAPLAAALERLVYSRVTIAADIHAALEHNDVLAAVVARLALWPLRADLPTREFQAAGWQQYLAAWRPGKPRPETWADNFDLAWRVVTGANDGRNK